MEYTTLGETGVTVSRICLGCMGFSTSDSSSRRYEWSCNEEESIEIIDQAIELGINFFDTANRYSYGESEEVLGKALENRDSDWPVVGTKVFFPTDESNPNSGGLSKKAIKHHIDQSLQRLGLDTIDLYQIHRWDYQTPIEVTLRALSDCVSRGKARYIGASSMWAHQFASALAKSDYAGLERFMTMQNHYNLVYREEEREMIPLCRQESIGILPWSPLAKGFLARPHSEIEATKRGKSDDLLHDRPYSDKGGKEINERVQQLAEEKGVSMAQIAISWLLHKDGIDAPIVGVTKVEHLEEAVEAVDINFTESDLAYIEEPYEPVTVTGHE